MQEERKKRNRKQLGNKVNKALFLLSSVACLATACSIVNANVKHTAYPKSYYSSNTDNISAGEYMQVKSEYAKVLLVNKEHALPMDYVPKKLVVPQVSFDAAQGEEKTYMEEEAASALEKLFAAAQEEQIALCGVSGYRSYNTQNELYYRSVYRNGLAYASIYSAQPGNSEHQTGLAIDVSCAEVGYSLVTKFAETKEGIWLAEHCSEYGFIVRYPEGKTDITGYAYEPWHIRYVGVRAAKYLKEHDITLDQYPGALSFASYFQTTNVPATTQEDGSIATTQETTTQQVTLQ